MKCFLLDSIILFAAVLPMAATAAGFPKNESSYLNFHIPHSLRRNESYPHRSAMFGEHYTQWGDAGSITLPVKVASGDLALCMPPSPDKMKEWHLPEDSAYILVAHRGSCTFVRKARVAQQIGAAALLIADPQSDKLPRTMANDGSGQDISIPSMLVGKDTWQEIEKHMGKNGTHGHVLAEIAWHRPKFENKVVLDFWHSPIDTHTKDFMANFSTLATFFDLSETHDDTNDLLEFHAHPMLIDGKELGCGDGNDETPDDPCYELCTNGGRYCHVSHHMVQGRDIVKESLRRLCIAKHYKNQHILWAYLSFFSEHCWDSDYYGNTACVEDAFKHSAIDENEINECMDNSGNPKNDVENVMLANELASQKQQGIIKSPTVLINNERTVLWGGLTPRNVLVALCESWDYGEKPHVCYACMMCGDPVACSQRTPMKCMAGDGDEKEDPNAHKDTGGGGGGDHGHAKKKSHWGRWLFGLMLIGGCVGAFFYYKKQQEGGDGLGAYMLQDAFESG